MELLDARGLKRLVLALERKHTANMELRMKYADQPDKFLESEVDLDEAVKALLVVASSPELYPDFARSSAPATLVGLLNHENSDVAADVVELLSELTDADAVEDAAEEASQLVDALLGANLLEVLVHRLATFDERVAEEAGAVNNCLAILENLVEVQPALADAAVERTELLKWLLSRLRPREADSNKQYASEILAILCQQSDANKRRMGEGDGIDAVLQAIAPYRNRDAETAEEEELVENLFDVLCSCLMLPANKRAFVEAEGVELMLLVLKGCCAHRTAALKCLDFATTACPPACERLVDQQGLRTLFGIFMGKLKVKKQDEAAAKEEEERTVSIIANLLAGLEAKPAKRDRVAAKFVEAEFEKCDRLMEVLFRYAAAVDPGEARLAEEAGEGYDEDDLLLARMDAGLYTLQQAALVAGALWALGDVGLRRRVLQLLHQKGRTLGAVRELLLEFRANLGDEGGEEERRKQVRRVTGMLLALGHQPEEGEEEALLAGGGRKQPQEQALADGEARAAAAPPAPAADADGDVEMGEEEEPEGQEPEAGAPPPAEPAADHEEGEVREGAGKEQEQRAAEPRRERSSGGEERGRSEGERREKRRREERREDEEERDRDRRRRREDDRERRRSRSRERRRSRSRERRRSRSRERERKDRRERR